MSSELDEKHLRILRFLKSKTFIGAFPEHVIGPLLRSGHIKHFSKGQTIFQRGDPGDYLLLIVSGQVKISNVTAEGREIVLNLLGAGDLNGEIALLDGGQRTAAATALQDTEAFVLFRRDLLPLLRGNPEALLEIVAILCEKLRQTSQIVEDFQRSMQNRLAAGLLRLVNQHGQNTGDGIVIDFALNQRDLGNYAGLSRENTNRVLRLLERANILVFRGGNMLIKDRAALQSLAESEPE
jgi:CRP-like cAMP-binding protein